VWKEGSEKKGERISSEKNKEEEDAAVLVIVHYSIS